jgi:putative FmdB family regulatory protein
MPIYDYVCHNGHRFEVIHGIDAAGPSECPVCGSRQVRKGVVAPTILFKGSGWAKKDRSVAARSGASSTDGKESSDGGAKEAEPSTSTAPAGTDGAATKSADGSAADKAAKPASGARSDSDASSGSRSSERTGSHDRNRPSTKSETKVERG